MPTFRGITQTRNYVGALLAVVLAAPALAEQWRPIYGPAEIIDGDTFVIGKHRIRLWGIDAPERYTPEGRRATEALKLLTANMDVLCLDTGGRSYGRIVAVCCVDGEDVAGEQVTDGHAKDWPKYSGGFYKGFTHGDACKGRGPQE